MPSLFSSLLKAYQNSLNNLKLEPSEDVILVDLGEKKLFHCQQDNLISAHTVSGGEKPMSCIENSEGTPWGLHEVVEKYGDDAPDGTVFVGRISTGKAYQEREDYSPRQKALVTTRILRLAGLEAGLNKGEGCDSYNRYIYIHGVNHPEKFPQPQSAGCLNLLDPDLKQIYKSMPIGSHVWINSNHAKEFSKRQF